MPVSSYFHVTPQELAVIKAAQMEGLDQVIAGLDLSVETELPRPIKLWLPLKLQEALTDGARRGHKKKDLLLAGAREFRRRFPQSKRLMDRPPDTENTAKRGRKSAVFRLKPADRHLLETIGQGNSKFGNRHDALLAMARIIKKMALQELPDLKRATVYVAMPESLHEAIGRRHRETGVPRVRILLEAIQNKDEPF